MLTISVPLSTAQLERRSAAKDATRHDAGLVQRFLGGDEPAFVEIMDRYRARLHTVALGVLRNHADAEEIVQDAFIRAHRALPLFRGDCSLATWLHRIALNRARNRYWYFFRRGRNSTLSLDSACSATNPVSFAEHLADDQAGPAHTALQREFSELVATCMPRLSPPQREILLLRNARQLSYREIGMQLGINTGTVKSRIARARESLRVLLASCCPEFGAGAQPSAWFEPQRTTSALLQISA